MTDRYTKLVLTVIAGALVIIAGRGVMAPASAQRTTPCGEYSNNPCYVQTPAFNPLSVVVVRQ